MRDQIPSYVIPGPSETLLTAPTGVYLVSAIRDTILTHLQERPRELPERILPFDVVFSPWAIEALCGDGGLERSEWLIRMGWLLTNLVSHALLLKNSSNDSAGNRPWSRRLFSRTKRAWQPVLPTNVIVRCRQESENLSEAQAARLSGWSWWQTRLRNLEGHLLGVPRWTSPPFTVYACRGAGRETRVTIEIKELLAPYRSLTRQISPESGWTLPPKFQDDRHFVLVDTKHAEILAVSFPLGGTGLYIRALGRHETWVYSSQGWRHIGRGQWAPLQKGNILVLGRMHHHNGRQYALPGSWLARVKDIRD